MPDATLAFENGELYAGAVGNYHFAFSMPEHFAANSEVRPEGTRYTITEASYEYIPAMTITVATNGQVTFALWEGIAWEWYDDVVESFTFTR